MGKMALQRQENLCTLAWDIPVLSWHGKWNVPRAAFGREYLQLVETVQLPLLLSV